MDELEIRLLRSFVTVAEELHFGRAAVRLHVAQPALSQQLRRLERQLGVELLTRTSRSVALTAAGAAFLEEARRTLAAADRAAEVARTVARGGRIALVVGFLAQGAGAETPEILAEFRRRRPDVLVRTRAMSFSDHLTALRRGEIEASLVRPPYAPSELTGLRLAHLLEEPRVAVLASGHPLAGRAGLRFEEIADEAFLRIPDGASDVWRAFWQVADRRGAVPARLSEETADSVEEMLAVVATGRCISVTHQSVGQFYGRPTVSFVPITDIAPSTLALAWRADDETPQLRAFLDAAIETTAARRPT
jgi:DNA-binding transcriptional LysR family regulator